MSLFLFSYCNQSMFCFSQHTSESVLSSHNSIVVEDIIKAIGTDKNFEGLIRSKINICSQSNLLYYLKFSK